MAKKSKNKTRHPKQKYNPSTDKVVRQVQDPSSYDRLTVAWRISGFDWESDWGEAALAGNNLEHLVRGWASDFELQTWGELLGAAGGRRAGNNHHPIDVDKLSKLAQKRLVNLRKDDLDSVFSFRISATVRVYGIRDGRVFNVLWFDPWHSDAKKAVCPASKRRT